MKVLLWLAIPVVALIIGIVWAYFTSRPPRPAAMQDSMESFNRFRTALAERPVNQSGRRRRPGHTPKVSDLAPGDHPAARRK
jgi:hypothetical protein